MLLSDILGWLKQLLTPGKPALVRVRADNRGYRR